MSFNEAIPIVSNAGEAAEDGGDGAAAAPKKGKKEAAAEESGPVKVGVFVADLAVSFALLCYAVGCTRSGAVASKKRRMPPNFAARL